MNKRIKKRESTTHIQYSMQFTGESAETNSRIAPQFRLFLPLPLCLFLGLGFRLLLCLLFRPKFPRSFLLYRCKIGELLFFRSIKSIYDGIVLLYFHSTYFALIVVRYLSNLHAGRLLEVPPPCINFDILSEWNSIKCIVISRNRARC
jgi:hypothetical protein